MYGFLLLALHTVTPLQLLFISHFYIVYFIPLGVPEPQCSWLLEAYFVLGLS